jgi:methenyltetrahydromethanopterin cyclohydrolase
LQLNNRAFDLATRLQHEAVRLRATVHCPVRGATVIDLGIEALGGLEAGRMLAEICVAGLARVELVAARSELWHGPAVAVSTDCPIAACMASQYAGWQVARGKYFAMGSGPMRAAAGKEAVFDKIGYRERAERVVGVLETRKLPTDEVLTYLAGECGIDLSHLTLLVAPTASQAGTIQIVARSVETALHKLFTLGFDLGRVESAWGLAPLPPVAKNDLAAIGRTNDAILYGGEVTLWVRGDDASLESIGPKIPSSASADHGQPFAAIFERYNRNFYDIDPHLFSPARVTLANLDSGRSHTFGSVMPEVIRRSFLEGE